RPGPRRHRKADTRADAPDPPDGGRLARRAGGPRGYGVCAMARPAARSLQVDVAVLGAGAAGLYASLGAGREGARGALVSATTLAQTASYWAQGGLAAALAADDSFELHLADTERAGRGLVRRSAA